MSLAEAFPPTTYRTVWSVSAVSMSDGAPIGTLEFLFNLLHASPVTSDVLAYQQTLNLAALIFAGTIRFSSLQYCHNLPIGKDETAVWS